MFETQPKETFDASANNDIHRLENNSRGQTKTLEEENKTKKSHL